MGGVTLGFVSFGLMFVIWGATYVGVSLMIAGTIIGLVLMAFGSAGLDPFQDNDAAAEEKAEG